MLLINLSEKYLNRFLAYLNGVKRYSPNTIKAYQTDILQFIDFCRSNNFAKATSNVIKMYLMNLNEINLEKRSISRKLSSLRHFFKYLRLNSVIELNPIEAIHNPKEKKKLPEHLSVKELQKIFDNLQQQKNKEDLMNLAIFDLLYGSALRVSELCSLQISNFDFHKKVVKVLGKGSKERIIPLGEKTIKSLKDYLESINYKENLFFKTKRGKKIYPEFVERLVKKQIAKVSDIKKKSPHTLRHSAATHMLDNGADLLAIKEILGHENLSTTQIYTHVSIEKLKKTYKTSHPKS